MMMMIMFKPSCSTLCFCFCHGLGWHSSCTRSLHHAKSLVESDHGCMLVCACVKLDVWQSCATLLCTADKLYGELKHMCTVAAGCLCRSALAKLAPQCMIVCSWQYVCLEVAAPAFTAAAGCCSLHKHVVREFSVTKDL